MQLFFSPRGTAEANPPAFLLRSSLIATALLLLCAVATPAEAGVIQKGDLVKVTWNGTAGNAYGGGEFQMLHKVGGNWTALDIHTFCLEVLEHTHLNHEFVVGGMGDTSVFGSGGANSGGVPLADETKFLYNAYATGKLATETGFTTGDNSWANSLQRVIWHFQGQPDWQNWQSHFSSSSLDQQLVNYVSANVQSGFDYGVYALNLFTKTAKDTPAFDAFDSSDPSTWSGMHGYRAQDMLVYSPVSPPPNTVPEPASVAVWMLAVGGMIATRRGWRGRSRKSQR